MKPTMRNKWVLPAYAISLDGSQAIINLFTDLVSLLNDILNFILNLIGLSDA